MIKKDLVFYLLPLFNFERLLESKQTAEVSPLYLGLFFRIICSRASLSSGTVQDVGMITN